MGNSNELSNEARLLMLIIIEKNGSIDDLHDLGYEYFQITKFLKNEIANGNAIFEDGKLLITEQGLNAKNQLINVLNIDNTRRFVLPQLGKQKTDILKLTDIFIPSEDDLMF